MNWVALFFETTVRASAVLVLAIAASFVLRRSAASLRHFLLTAAFGALVLLPATMIRPSPPARPAAPSHANRIVVTVHPAPPPVAPQGWTLQQRLLLLWAIGCGLAAGRFFLGAARVSWMAAMGEKWHGAVVSPAAPVPMVWGILRPIILLPASAREWPGSRVNAVMLHERMHIRRHDLASQLLAQVACCLYWFHPLVWVAAAWHRREQELACDDAVLREGIAASEYAGHLLEVARTASLPAPAMAEMSHLEYRVRAVLDRSRARGPVSGRAAVTVAALAIAACLIPLTPRTARAQEAGRGSLSGAVIDPSGAFVPNAYVTARNLEGKNEEITHANAAGQFRFASVPPGPYSVEVSSAGFRPFTGNAAVTPGLETRITARLAIGGISEVVTVTGSKPSNAPAPQTVGTPQRIRVGGMVQMSRLVKQPRPIYPYDAQQQGVEGTVRIRAIISKTGDVLSASLINTDVDSRLVQSAMESVKQWKYEPTLLNGEPVEVLTTIDVVFELN